MVNMEKAVKGWWKGFRPLGWSFREHCENPTVNMSRIGEIKLAKALMRFVKENVK